MMKKKAALRDNIVSLLLGFAGQSNTLTIPRPFINLCNGDHLAALLLSQILYWQERTEDKAGWFAKSYEDWYDELGLTEYQIKRIIQGDKRNKNQICKLSDLGIETSLRRSKFYKGAATLHYRVNMAAFQKRVLNIVQNDDVSNVQNDDANIVPERITTETIAKTTTENITTSSTDENKEPSTRPRDEMYDLITAAWEFPNNRAVQFKKYFQGGYVKTSDRKSNQRYAEWIAHSAEVVAQPFGIAELRGFINWYLDTAGDKLPEAPEKLETWVFRFRRSEDYRLYFPSETPAESAPEPVPVATGDTVDAAADYERLIRELANAKDGNHALKHPSRR